MTRRPAVPPRVGEFVTWVGLVLLVAVGCFLGGLAVVADWLIVFGE